MHTVRPKITDTKEHNLNDAVTEQANTTPRAIIQIPKLI